MPKMLSQRELWRIEKDCKEALRSYEGMPYPTNGLRAIVVEHIPNLLATIEVCHDLLQDAFEWIDHSPGCSGGIRVAGQYPYLCKCGLVEWQEKAKKVLDGD